jgi:TetR/AcrR family fatty acid metabolism transcriptional regulator
MGRTKNNDKYYRIIRAALKIFAKKGFYHAKISEIAGEAQIADGTIYLYFKNKDDILISLFEEQMKYVIQNMVAEIYAQDNPVDKLKKFALIHLQMIEQNRDMAEIIQVELRQSSEFMKEYKNEKFAEYLELISNIIREGQEKGIFKKSVVPGIAKRAFFGALDEMSRFWVLSSRRKYDINTASQQISEFFLEGIRT